MQKSSIFFLVMVVLVAACKQEYVNNPQEASSIKKAKVVELESTVEPIPILASGKVQALENMKLSFKTGGIIRQINVQQGQYVQKGQILAQLDMSEINAQVSQAAANVEKFQRDLNRFRRLYADSAATLQNVQDLETGLQVAESNLVIAQFNQSYSKIIAPVAGRIQLKMAEENELVNPGQPIFSLGTEQGMSLNVGLTDKEIVKLKLGDVATIAFDAYPSETTEARITEIAAEGHPMTGTFMVELTISNYPFELKPGFFATASILPGTQQPYFKVPMHAIVEGMEDEVAIYTPQESKVKKMILSPEYIGEDFFTVTVKDARRMEVITDGASYLSEGESFETINE